ncbi:sn-glycerol-3-phosphate ABC transporter ATP-binding protein UgpC [Nitratireductor aquimarinus]|uniref:Sn-glycerol-3-phosphate ABC transporter ATP-binding protein UgpC n=1 Tax=Nitratireductor aquimarinus TaxID=889300 RepID=A0ABU4AMS8_9HYPH|nr:sn-glycerol-3-phosphate ABC transporter ATP-binding protein UgpC [Nitratireductor aquimarinus]MDV6227546.1 sn-glycerol-3-phosphate ABC transporter ATP-binding protein UgpC [Nitratireductor aquimarinus]
MADIDIRKVEKFYGKNQVVHGVDLNIQDGEFIVILGPSGCGKSTLLRMIAGLEEISNGEISIENTVVNQLEPRERGCAMVFQNYALYPHMTVAQNIGYALKVGGMRKAERMQKVEATAKSLGLDQLLDRKPAQLSGGQRQRVAMGRAIVREPKVFLFDEPLSNLDAKLRVQMRLEIRRLHRTLKATSVFVTHDQVEAMSLADRLVVMNAGRIEQVGTPEEVYHAPASIYVGGFIGSPAMNFLPCGVSDCGTFAVIDNTGFRLPVDPEIGRTIAGQSVIVGLRPEDLKIAPEANDPNLLTVAFDFSEEQGSGRLMHGRLAGRDFVLHSAGRHHPAPGAPCSLAIGAESVHLFDPTTEKRITVAGAKTGQTGTLPAAFQKTSDVTVSGAIQ